MGFPSPWRWALFMCVLIANHQFILAGQLFQDHVIMARALRRHKHNHSGGADIASSGSLSNNVKSYRNSTSGIARQERAHKRFFFLFLFVVSLVVTVVATTVETIYDIAGCCGLSFNFLCGFEEKFDNKKAVISQRAEAVDANVATAVKLEERMEAVGIAIEEAWKEVERVILLQQQIASALDPYFLDAVQKKLRELQKDNTLDGMEMPAIEAKLDPLQRNLKLAMSWGMGVAIPSVEKIASSAFKKVKIGKIYKALKAKHAAKLFTSGSKASKILGFSDEGVKAFMKTTAVSRFGSIGGKAAKFMKLMKGAGAVMSIVSIGLDLYNLISTLVDCGKKQSQARDAMAELDQAERDIEQSEQDFIEFDAFLRDQLRTVVIPNVTDVRLQEALLGVKDIIDNMDKTIVRDWDVNACLTKFDDTIHTLSTATHDSNLEPITNQLNNLREQCMSKLKYTLACKLRKADMVMYVVNGCIAGEVDSLTLYGEAVYEFGMGSSSQCHTMRGEPYTTRSDVLRILDTQAEALGFDTDCRMNDPYLAASVCRRSTESPSKIASIYHISESQVQKLLGKCDDAPSLTPRQIADLCLYRNYDFTDADIADRIKASEDAVSAYDECPSL